MSEKGVVVKAAGLIMVLGIIGRLMGFVREQVIAARFGTTMATDSYVMALTIPNIFYVILGGALAAVFIPVFTSTLVEKGKEDASRLGSSIFNLTAIILAGITLVGALCAPWLVAVIAPGFSPAARELTISLTRIMFPLLLLTALSMLVGGVLNSLRHFALPALVPVAYSGTVILSVYLLAPELGIYGLAIGTVAALAVQILIQLPALRGSGIRYSLSIDLRKEEKRTIGELLFPAMLGTALTQAYVFIDRVLASTLAAGSIASLNFANKLMLLPFNLFVMAINTAVFPSLSRLAAAGDKEELGNTVAFGINLIAFLTLPAAVGLFVLASPIVQLLFEHGAFNARSTQMTAFALQFYVLGLFGQGVYNILNRCFYSLQDTKTPVKISVVVVLLNLAFSLILIRPLRHGGLALSASLAATVNMILVYWFLRRKLPCIPERRMFINLGRILLASLVMGAAVFALQPVTGSFLDLSAISGQAINLLLLMTAGLAAYLAAAVLLRVEEIRLAYERIRARRSRQAS